MRSGLFVLPFIALFVAAIGTVIGSAFQDLPWISYSGWACAAAIIGIWVVLDLDGFKKIFTRKGAKYGASSGLSIFLGLLVIIGLAVLSTKPRFNKSIDLTKSGKNTLDEQTVKILNNLKEQKKEIEVIAFFGDEEQKTVFQDLAQLYSRVSDSLKIEYLDPQVENLKAQAFNLTSPNTVIFKYGPRESRVTTFTEEKITNAIVNILKDKAKKIYFTTGHGEGDLKSGEEAGFELAKKELEGNKYEIESLSLVETAKVPEDADILVIAGPKYEFKSEELDFIEKYLKNGGALLVMVDAMTPATNLNTLLEKYGIRFNDDFLVLQNDDPRAALFGQNMAIVSKFDDFSPVTKDFSKQSNVAMLLPNTRTISEISNNPNQMKVEIVGKTAEANAKIKGVKNRSDLEGLNESRIETGEFGVLGVALGKTKKDDPAAKETRIVVSGSVQFANNWGAQRAEHRDLFLNITDFLVRDEDFISIRPKDEEKTTVDLSSPQSQLSLAFFAFIYPFLYLGGGIWYWLKRRRA